MRLLLLMLGYVLLGYADIAPVNIIPSSVTQPFMQIRILDQKELTFSSIDGVKFTEISDLAYDKVTKKLYMVGDKGSLFSFDMALSSNKIDTLMPYRAAKLKNRHGKKFKKWKRDSEGLVLDGKRRLYISFEGKAKIGWFHKNSEKFASLIRKRKLPKVLRKVKHYRSKNKSLEALAWHPRYGLLTAAEWPLKRDDKKRQTIYALSGRVWHFKAEPESRSAVVAMEVMDDGNVLVLERSYTGLLNPFIVTLKKVYLNQQHHGWCRTKVLAKFNSHQGWDVDNFEGLTKVGKHRYLMISDDNENFFQKTLLIYFEVIE